MRHMLLIHTIPLVANTYLYSRVPYDVLNDFVPVSLLSSSPSLLAVYPSLPARSVRGLLQLAKSRPGALIDGARLLHCGSIFAMRTISA